MIVLSHLLFVKVRRKSKPNRGTLKLRIRNRGISAGKKKGPRTGREASLSSLLQQNQQQKKSMQIYLLSVEDE